MVRAWHGWAIALLGSVVLHAALTIGVRIPQPGNPMKSAGAPVSVSGTLAGILGTSSAPVVEAAKTDTEVRPVDVAKPAPTAPVEPVVARPIPPLKAEDVPPTSKAVRAPPPTRAVDAAAAVTPLAPPVAEATTPTIAQPADQQSLRERQTRAVPPVAARPADAVPPRDITPAKRKRAVRQSRPELRKKRVRQTRRSATRASPGSNQRGAAGSARGGQRGRSRARPGAMRSYASRVRSRILANRPRRAGSGRVVVVFSLSPRGRLRFVRISRRSGNAALDRAALATVRRSAPFPRPPRGASSQQLTFTIPFWFN